MHGPINVKSPNNISEWQMGLNSAFKGLKVLRVVQQVSNPEILEHFIAAVFVVSKSLQ
jgi:hypothetical protein